MDALLPELSACVPAHDEEANLEAAAGDLLAELPRVAARWELILVDDGSRDRTGALADELARRHPEVRVVHHARNRGYGAAVRSGLAAARYAYVFLTDGDRQFDPGEIPRLVAALDGADVAVGYRARRADPLGRRLSGRAWNLLVRVLFGLPVRDVNCAFKLFRRSALDGVALRAEGAAVSVELLAALRRRGHRIVELPVGHRPRRAGTPSGGSPRVALRALVELWRLRRDLDRAVTPRVARA